MTFKENLLHIIQYNEDNGPQPILELQQMSLVEIQEKLKLAMGAIKSKLEILNNRKKNTKKPSVKNRKNIMTPKQIAGKTIDMYLMLKVRMVL